VNVLRGKGRRGVLCSLKLCDPCLSASEASFSQWGTIQIEIPLPFFSELTQTWNYRMGKLAISLFRNLSTNLYDRSLGTGRRISHYEVKTSRSGCCRSCNVFPTVNVNGTLRHLLLTPFQLIEYQQQLQHVLSRYLQRLQWLLSGKQPHYPQPPLGLI